jgi:hypothetical protein
MLFVSKLILIRYSRACVSYRDFLYRLDYSKENSKAWVPGGSVDVITSKVNHYEIFVSQMTTYKFQLS